MSLHAKKKARKRRAKKRGIQIFSYKRKNSLPLKEIKIAPNSLTLIKNKIPQLNILIEELKILEKGFNLNIFFKKINSRVRSNVNWNTGINSDRVGILSEFYVELCLEVLKSENYILNFLPTAWKGSADRKGVDFQIILITEKKYLTLRLQVKSSKLKQKEHIKRNNGEEIKISSIVSSPHLSKTLEKIKKIIAAAKKGKALHL